jgi:putative spermidine/putrescine transport system substrate-binding protein
MTKSRISRRHISRRAVLGAGIAAVAAANISRRAWAQEEPVIIFGSHGGIYDDVLRKTIFDPFTKATGIVVKSVQYPSIAKVKAMVETNTVDVDVADLDGKDLRILSRRGLLEAIDYSRIPKEYVDSIVPHAKHSHGVGQVVFPGGIVYSSAKFKGENRPRSWADVWDVKKFPGPRTFPDAVYQISPLEIALLADGVAPDKLYPLDVDRAFRSLDRIKPNVVKWWKGGAEGAQLLTSGNADLGASTFGRIITMKQQGQPVPVDIEFNQALAKTSFWMMPKGAKHVGNVHKLIAFYSEPRNQAAFINQYPAYGPVNTKSSEFLDPKITQYVATSPENAARLIWVDDDWWAKEDAAGKTNYELVLERWSKWVSA